MEAGKRTIRDIFNRGRNLEIPFFKDPTYGVRSNGRDSLRICKWFQQIKNLISLGSVILKQQQTTSNNDSILTVIDGQQR